MTFSEIQGNNEVKDALRAMVDSGRIPHAIMFHEDDGGGAMPMVLAFLQYLYCRQHTQEGDACMSCPSCNRVAKLIHPDIHFIFPTIASATSNNYMLKWRDLLISNPSFSENELSEQLGIEGKSLLIAVNEAKGLLQKLSLGAMEAGYTSIVVYLPEKMNQETANKLLKIIEEPPAKTLLLFITHSPESVLQTIQSRCQRIRVVPQESGRVYKSDATEQYLELLSALLKAVSAKDMLSAVDAGEEIASLPSRESIKAFCKFVGSALRDIFIAQQGMAALKMETNIDATAFAKSLKKTFPRLALEALDRSLMLIGRNVNARIVFTEMAIKWLRINL